jgi:hypothetical protein
VHPVRGAAARHRPRVDRPGFRAAALLLSAFEPARERVHPVSEQLEHAHPGKGLLDQGTMFPEPLFLLLLPFHPPKRVHGARLARRIQIQIHFIYLRSS